MRKQKKTRTQINVQLPIDLDLKSRSCVFYTPGLTLTDLISDALEREVERRERERGEPFPTDKSIELSVGRPLKMRRSMEVSVKKMTLQESNEEEYRYYASITPAKRIEILLNLLSTQGTLYGAIERSIRVYPITKQT